MDLEIRILSPADTADFMRLIHVFETVFEMQDFVYPDQKHLERLLTKENFIAITASNAHHLVGGMTVYFLDQYYSTKPLAYIYDLAVLKQFQRQGIGKKLINFLNEYCRNKGFEEVFVQADRVDDYAIDFYRSTSPSREEQVIHFSYFLDK